MSHLCESKQSDSVRDRKAYSLDLRTRVVEAIDRQGGPQQEVATLFGVSCTFLKKLLRQRRETGSLAPKPHGGGHVAKLTEDQREQVRAYILGTRNDATVSEGHTYVVMFQFGSCSFLCRTSEFYIIHI
jgi:transposase